jgi:hypothetical protein
MVLSGAKVLAGVQFIVNSVDYLLIDLSNYRGGALLQKTTRHF